MPRPQPVLAFFTILFQQFMQESRAGPLPGGGSAYFLSAALQMPQIYLTAGIAAVFWGFYLLGARQYRRLRWTLPRAAGIAVVTMGLRVAWQVGTHHAARANALLGWAQFVILFLAVPVLVLISARLARPDSVGAGTAAP